MLLKNSGLDENLYYGDIYSKMSRIMEMISRFFIIFWAEFILRGLTVDLPALSEPPLA